LEDLHHQLDSLIPSLMSRFGRPSWDEYFMSIAKVVATRSNCMKRKVAAIIVKEKRVISTGYNGTPRGAKNCNEGGCPRCNNMAESGTALDECLCCHGEENAIAQAAYHGTSLKGSTLYTTYAPCLLCTKMIINCGIAEVVYNQDYPLNDRAMGLLRNAEWFFAGTRSEIIRIRDSRRMPSLQNQRAEAIESETEIKVKMTMRRASAGGWTRGIPRFCRTGTLKTTICLISRTKAPFQPVPDSREIRL
jgi:dCMP deaminase